MLDRPTYSDKTLNLEFNYKMEEGQRLAWQEMAWNSPVVKACWAQWVLLEFRNRLLKMTIKELDGTEDSKRIMIPPNKHLHGTKTVVKLGKRFYCVNCQVDLKEWC